MSKPGGGKSFPLAVGWLIPGTLLLPAGCFGLAVMVFSALRETGNGAAANAELDDARELSAMVLAVFAVPLGIRLAIFIRTVLFDHSLVLGPDALHVPVVGLFQLLPWNIPFRELTSINATRRSGGSTQLILGLSRGRTRSFSAALVSDRSAVIRAIDQRIRRGTAELD